MEKLFYLFLVSVIFCFASCRSEKAVDVKELDPNAFQYVESPGVVRAYEKQRADELKRRGFQRTLLPQCIMKNFINIFLNL